MEGCEPGCGRGIICGDEGSGKQDGRGEGLEGEGERAEGVEEKNG